MNMNKVFPATVVAMAALAACSSTPAPNARLEEARVAVRNAQSTTQVGELAGGELKQAADSLNKAEAAWMRSDTTSDVDHLAYLAKQRAAIAQETGKQKIAERAVTEASAARDRIRLTARTSEADRAQQSAATAELQSQASQRQAEASGQRAQASQRRAEESQRSAETSTREAVAAQQQASDAEARSSRLEQQLKDMNAKKTDRGAIVTIGDVLFDTDRSQIKAGASRHIEQLGSFMTQYPQRRALIEGFTDSTGSEDHNQELSGRRAAAVRAALVELGVASNRIETRGYGESHPVAGNDNAAGRQLNRRVEVILSDDDGLIAPR